MVDEQLLPNTFPGPSLNCLSPFTELPPSVMPWSYGERWSKKPSPVEHIAVSPHRHWGRPQPEKPWEKYVPHIRKKYPSEELECFHILDTDWWGWFFFLLRISWFEAQSWIWVLVRTCRRLHPTNAWISLDAEVHEWSYSNSHSASSFFIHL